jgi:hypothetical protein
MRSSLLTRSAVAVASLAIGSVALAAVPASAAAPAGVTRTQVLEIAQSLRGPGGELTQSARTALTSIVAAACGTTAETVRDVQASPTAAGGNADGFVVKAALFAEGTIRYCDFGAVAVVDPAFALSGTSSITAQITNTPAPGSGTAVTQVGTLSDQVALTPLVNGTIDTTFSIETSFTAIGNATKSSTVTKTVKVKDKKSKAEKKAAKKKYSKRLAQAKKNYAKALDKAGKSKSKKAAAKRVYAKARALAKAKYAYATAGHKNVKRTSTVVENRPFSVTASRSGIALP